MHAEMARYLLLGLLVRLNADTYCGTSSGSRRTELKA